MNSGYWQDFELELLTCPVRLSKCHDIYIYLYDEVVSNRLVGIIPPLLSSFSASYSNMHELPNSMFIRNQRVGLL